VSGPAAGGIRRHLSDLVEALPARGFRVAGAVPEGLRLPGADRFPLPIGDRPRPLQDLRAAMRLRAAVRDWSPHVVHAHGVKAALLTLGSGLRAPVVITFHNLWGGGALTKLLRLFTPRAAGVICVSEAVKASLIAAGVPLPQAQVIYNGVDLRRFFPASPASAGAPGVGFIGRLTGEKGIDTLLGAMRRVREAVPARLVVAGDGPFRGSVEGAGDLEYLGAVEDVVSVYRSLTLVAIPSRSEGLSMTALEAMACGLPVVASRVGGLPEVVVEGETGILVPPGDADALAAAILSLVRDPKRAAALGEAGRRRVEARFTLDEMVDRVAEVYRGVQEATERRRRR
jgi:glycosyltransferase involved in cell wall biosynthesis